MKIFFVSAIGSGAASAVGSSWIAISGKRSRARGSALVGGIEIQGYGRSRFRPSGSVRYFSGDAEDSKDYKLWNTWCCNKLLKLGKLPKNA